MTFLGALTLLLIALKLMGVITISWLVAFTPILIGFAFWVFIFIANIVFILIINKKIEKDLKHSIHSERMREFDESFQKAKADWEAKFGNKP